MPYSIVIDFYCQDKKIKEYNLYPGTIYALVLNIIRTVDPELSEKLHDELANKSITVRTIYQMNHYLIVKLTLLNDELFQKFSSIMIQACIPSFQLNNQSVKISKIFCTNESETPWAKYQSYREIFEQASKVEYNLNFEIETPLAFKKGDNFTPLPIPDLFFKSLHKRWNSHSEIKLDDKFIEFVEKYIYLSRFKIETDSYSIDRNLEFTGVTGKFTFTAQRKASKEFIHYLNVLSDYSFFSGVGIKTAMGMGQVYRLVDKRAGDGAEASPARTGADVKPGDGADVKPARTRARAKFLPKEEK